MNNSEKGAKSPDCEKGMVINMKKASKQIAAWICIILLVLLYVVTFIAALLDSPGSGALFRSCLMATIVVPILLWIFIWIYGKTKDNSSNSGRDSNLSNK